MKYSIISVALLVAGCSVEPVRTVYVEQRAPVYRYVEPGPVISVYVEPTHYQPAPIAIGWAPPPMLVESLPASPFDGAVWIGGYWVWEGNWIWAHGRWAPPPQPSYGWVHPYYENRGASVIFINGFWAAPGVQFIAPSPSLNISIAIAGPGVIAGPSPIGPLGVFVPPPPGSRVGLVIPAPIGTAPAVVTGVPPVVNVGMRITSNINSTTIVNNTTNINKTTNITNVTIIAPASATATGQAVNASIPAQAHLAAAMKPMVKAQAPDVISTQAIPAYTPGRKPLALPPAQPVRTDASLLRTQVAPLASPSPAPVPPHAAPMPTPPHPSVQGENIAPQNKPAPNAAQEKSAKDGGARREQPASPTQRDDVRPQNTIPAENNSITKARTEVGKKTVDNDKKDVAKKNDKEKRATDKKAVTQKALAEKAKKAAKSPPKDEGKKPREEGGKSER